MPYNNISSRLDVESRIPEEVSRTMLDKATEQSAAMQLFRRVPVSRDAVRFPVLSALPMAYFVQGDTGLKQTTEMAWSNKFMHVEEIATVLPIPENVLDDIENDFWSDAEPYLREAFARVLDQAIFFGVNAPSSWPTSVVDGAIAAGNIAGGATTAETGGFFGTLDDALGHVEEDGFDVTGWLADRSVRRELRGIRDSQGRKLDEGRISGDLNTLDGAPITYPMSNLWPAGVKMLAGDWQNQFVLGIRQDITMKLLTESVITDNTGAIIYNLPQQDMVALRLKARFAWQVANTLNNQNPNEATRYPAVVINDTGEAPVVTP